MKMTTINSNIPALVASNSLRINGREMGQAMSRLSTGNRINSAQDDPAGSKVASRLEAASRANRAGVSNANSAITMLQTYATAGQTIVDVVIRMKELAVLGSTSILSENDRLAIDTEYFMLGREWSRIATQTQWNGSAGMGTYNSSFQVRLGEGTTAASTMTMELRNWNPIDETVNENVTGATTLSSDDDNADPLQAFEFVRDNAQNTVAATANGASDDHIQTRAAASAAVAKLDTAIIGMNKELAKNGAYINRLIVATDNLTAVATAQETSRSKIVDADYATETTILARTQIVSQAATAMLAQANAAKQTVLSLLQ
jgi:flagellin